jgi:tRNA(Arg) A34 adenosine deaminase TadA
MGAIYWANIEKVYFAVSGPEAAEVGFDDTHIYREIRKPKEDRNIPCVQISSDMALEALKDWSDKQSGE